MVLYEKVRICWAKKIYSEDISRNLVTLLKRGAIV